MFLPKWLWIEYSYNCNRYLIFTQPLRKRQPLNPLLKTEQSWFTSSGQKDHHRFLFYGPLILPTNFHVIFTPIKWHPTLRGVRNPRGGPAGAPWGVSHGVQWGMVWWRVPVSGEPHGSVNSPALWPWGLGRLKCSDLKYDTHEAYRSFTGSTEGPGVWPVGGRGGGLVGGTRQWRVRE